MFLSYGGRPTKGNGRKRKGVDEYAAENQVDFTAESIMRDGQLIRVLVCRFCCQSIGARSDRIKEHIASKRHQKLKTKSINKLKKAGQDFFVEDTIDDDSFNGSLLGLPKSSSTSMETENSDEKLFETDEHDVKDIMPNSDSMNSHPRQNIPGLVQMYPDSEVFSGELSRDPESNASVSASECESPPSPPQPPEEPSSPSLLCIQWVNYQSNIATMFSKFLSLKHLADVTLWCEGRTIKCHKIILSAGSDYFENLFMEVEVANKHPIVFLKDIKFWEAQSLVEFMYQGVVNIPQGKLPSLLKAAKSLQIKGLCHDSSAISEHYDGNEATEEYERASKDYKNNSRLDQRQKQSKSSTMPTSPQDLRTFKH